MRWFPPVDKKKRGRKKLKKKVLKMHNYAVLSKAGLKAHFKNIFLSSFIFYCESGIKIFLSPNCVHAANMAAP